MTRDNIEQLKTKIRALESELAQSQRVAAEREASEERFRILFENAPDACYLNDMRGNFVDGNQAAERLIGYAREELVGKNMLELPVLSPGQIPRAAMLLARNAMGQSTGPDEFALSRKDGQTVAVEIRTHVVEVEGRNLVLGIARDVSQRKREEEELRRRRDELERLVAERTEDLQRTNEHLREEVQTRERRLLRERVLLRVRQQIWEMKVPGDIGKVLIAVRDSLGEYDVPFAGCSMNLIDLADEPSAVRIHRMHRVDEEWRTSGDETADNLLRDIWRRGEVCYRRDLRAEDRYGESSGISNAYGVDIRSVLDIPFSHGTLAVNSTAPDAFSDEHINQMRELAGVMEEGFRRMDDLARLARSREHFRTLVETPELGVVLMTVEGRYLYVNPYWVARTGYSADEFYADHTLGRQLVHPEDMPAVQEMIDRVRRGEVCEGIEFRWRPRGGGEYSWAVETVYPVRDHLGQVSALQALLVDIDQRKQVEREMIRLERLRALGELAAGVSHNLNNILTGIIGPAEQLTAAAENPGARAEARAILAAAQRAGDLVKRLHRSVTLQGDEALQDVSLAQAVEEAVRIARPRWQDEAAAKGIGIEVRADLPGLPAVRCNAAQLQDILINLLFNAIDALPAGGLIAFGGSAAGGRVALTVRDTGVGMAPEVQRRIFEPFFTTKADVGTGLGLATVYNTMKNWQGSIAVESKPGEGTQFTLQFPRGAADQAPASVAARAPGPAAEPGRPLRVLVVEDDQQVASFLAKVVGPMGEVEVCNSGAEALARFEAATCDVAILDLGLPDMAGDEIARALRNRDPALGLILVSGWRLGDQDLRRQPFDLYLPKPFAGLGEIREAVVRAAALRDERGVKPVLP